MTRRRNRGAPNKGRASQETRQDRAQRLKPVGFLVDVIVPVYGEWGFLVNAISKVEAAFSGMEDPYRIIVVDNGTPGWEQKDENGEPNGVIITPEEQSAPVREYLRKEDIFFRLEENIGYPGALNAAAARGNSPLIIVLTADVFMEPGSFTTLVREMDNPEVGVVGPLLRFPLDESPNGPPGGVQSAGIAFDIQGDPYHVFIGWSPENPRVKKRREMQGITGACYITRRSLWDQIGGMSPVYGAGTYEDLEYCFQVRALESKVIFLPDAEGFHFVGGSIMHGAGKGGFPLGTNSTIFKGRWATRLQWDAFKWH